MVTAQKSVEELRERIAMLKARISAAMLSKSNETHVPPAGVRSAAARGLELRDKWGRGGLSNGEASEQGIGSGVQRAVNLKNGDAISIATVKRMHAFFSRHQKNYRPDEKEPDGGPTAGTIAWLLWGGNAGKAWSSGIVERVEKMQAPECPQAVKETLIAKAEGHNYAVSETFRLAHPEALERVWKRGAAGASRGSEQAAKGMGRVNDFLRVLRLGDSRPRPGDLDADLLPSGHPRSINKSDPGPGDVHVPSTDMAPMKRKKQGKKNRWPAGTEHGRGGAFAPAKLGSENV